MIGVDPHKASHTAVAVNAAGEPLGQLRVRASAVRAERLPEWARGWPERAGAVEGAGGLGHLLARQLLWAGERVLDVPPGLAARVRLPATGNISKNDPGRARPVAVAALRSAQVREVRRDDHAAVLKVWSKRCRDLGRARTRVACRLRQVLCELIPAASPQRSPQAGPGKSWHRPHQRGRWKQPAGNSPPSSPRTCAVSTRGSARPARKPPPRSGRPGPA